MPPAATRSRRPESERTRRNPLASSPAVMPFDRRFFDGYAAIQGVARCGSEGAENGFLDHRWRAWNRSYRWIQADRTMTSSRDWAVHRSAIRKDVAGVRRSVGNDV